MKSLNLHLTLVQAQLTYRAVFQCDVLALHESAHAHARKSEQDRTREDFHLRSTLSLNLG